MGKRKKKCHIWVSWRRSVHDPPEVKLRSHAHVNHQHHTTTYIKYLQGPHTNALPILITLNHHFYRSAKNAQWTCVRKKKPYIILRPPNPSPRINTERTPLLWAESIHFGHDWKKEDTNEEGVVLFLRGKMRGDEEENEEARGKKNEKTRS